MSVKFSRPFFYKAKPDNQQISKMFSLTGLFKWFSSTADAAPSAAVAPRFSVNNDGQGEINPTIHVHLHTSAPVTGTTISVDLPSRPGSTAVDHSHSQPRQRIQSLRRQRRQDARETIARNTASQGTRNGAHIQRPPRHLERAHRPLLSHAGPFRDQARPRSRIITRDASPALSDMSGVSIAATFGGSSRESSPDSVLFPLSGPRTGNSLGSAFQSIPSAGREPNTEITEGPDLHPPQGGGSQEGLFEGLRSLSPAGGSTRPHRGPRDASATAIPVSQKRKRTVRQAEGYDGDDSDSEFEVETARRVRRKLSSSKRIPAGPSSAPLSHTNSTAPTLVGITGQEGSGKGKKRARATDKTDHSSSEEDSPSPTKRPCLLPRPRRITRPRLSGRAERGVQASPAITPDRLESVASWSSLRPIRSQVECKKEIKEQLIACKDEGSD